MVEQQQTVGKNGTATSHGGCLRKTGGESVVITINSDEKTKAANIMMDTQGKKRPECEARQQTSVHGNALDKSQAHYGTDVQQNVEQRGAGNESSEQKQRNDSFELDNEIKRVSLNFCNSQFEKQFRSTSDITSCVSLVGLPITLICAFSSLIYLYEL